MANAKSLSFTKRVSDRGGAVRLIFLTALLAGAFAPVSAQDRSTVEASEPQKLSVTVYRDPQRGEDEEMSKGWPRGFAMITEEREVILPPGRSAIRFDGVAEGMVAVTAIVTGLPGGTIEKNRNAQLLSPAALVDGSLGNRVTITRTNPVSGQANSEQAIVRTRADGGLVLQTSAGFEAVRCSGLPEKLTFDRIPQGLSAKPVYSIDTQSNEGGTYRVALTYLAWGFDWEANYVAHLRDGRRDGTLGLDLVSWLTILNDNGQSFPDAELMAVAGMLNVESDYEDLADPPVADPLRLVCYPIGSTAAGSPVAYPVPPPPPAPPAPISYAEEDSIVVTGSRVNRALESASPIAIIASEEQLGDLKLYRIPVPVTVAAKSTKQVAFLDRKNVRARFIYVDLCELHDQADDLEPASILLATVNEEAKGLGQALPTGGIAIYEPSSAGDQLVAETRMRDYAVSQDIELTLPDSTQVFAECGNDGVEVEEGQWVTMRAEATNANDAPVTVRFDLGRASEFEIKGLGKTRVKDGKRLYEFKLPANGKRKLNFRMKPTG